ncbi:sulfatase family protein [Novipirellula sp. SH528]|uniref:sulfatase family protein n=1 Tax=Novipirellula sp. SH528 TaxID=3454466 RepID=UPI003F9ED0C6
MQKQLLLTCLLVAFTASTAQGDRPNILFLLTDDQAYHTLGVTGNEQVKTPNIDTLARRGVIFDRHYDTTAICMGSRANIMSGMYEYKNGCNFMHGAMGTKQWSTSYPVLLKNAGYRVANAGKFGFGVHDQKNLDKRGIEGTGVKDAFDLYLTKGGQCNYTTAKNKGLDKYEQDHPHLTQALAAATIDFVRDSVKQGQPFCMTVGFKAPHKPFEPDPQFDHVYQDTVWKKPGNYGRQAGLHLAEQSRQDRQYRTYWEESYSTDEKYQHTLRVYHQLIYGVDVAVGKLVEELKKLGIEDNTVIIYSSDNGYLMGAHGLGGKTLPYEEGARAPLIIYDPRNPKSGTMRRTDSLSGNIDIAATILDVAGLDIPDVYDGKSLMPIVEDETVRVRDTLPIIQVFGQEATRCLSVINGQYKYIYWYYTDEEQGMQPTEELFQLTKDPLEMTNLAGNPEYQPMLEKMRAQYDSQVKRWAEQSIDYNGYQEYGTLLDRQVQWKTKARVISEKDAKIAPPTKSSE